MILIRTRNGRGEEHVASTFEEDLERSSWKKSFSYMRPCITDAISKGNKDNDDAHLCVDPVALFLWLRPAGKRAQFLFTVRQCEWVIPPMLEEIMKRKVQSITNDGNQRYVLECANALFHPSMRGQFFQVAKQMIGASAAASYAYETVVGPSETSTPASSSVYDPTGARPSQTEAAPKAPSRQQTPEAPKKRRTGKSPGKGN